VSGIDSRSIPTRRPENPAALGVAAVALAGMAYCHIKDVGMKFEEDVYYMALLSSAATSPCRSGSSPA
jgi:hypothetical protein